LGQKRHNEWLRLNDGVTVGYNFSASHMGVFRASAALPLGGNQRNEPNVRRETGKE
jgi:hypothetical protein